MTSKILCVLLACFLFTSSFSANINPSFAQTNPKNNIIQDSKILDPPLTQIKAGVSAEDIMCRDGLTLVIKSENGLPACVTPLTMLRLIEIKWGHIKTPFVTKVDLLNSVFNGNGKILKFEFDWAAPSILIEMRATDDGSLRITIPTVLTNFMSWYDHNKNHSVLIDGKIVELNETLTPNGATITIPFHNGTKIIEIVGSN